MKKLLIALGFLCVAQPALAEVFVWNDPNFKVEATFPDNWMRQANLDEHLRLFVLAPQGQEHAACRLYIKDDPRYKDAPANYQQAVNQYVFTPEVLQREVYERPDTDAVRVTNYKPHASLGKGAAVMGELEFNKIWAGQVWPMRAMVFASLYHGKNIFMSCESLASGWQSWHTVMEEIVKSVNFPAAWTPDANSYYRRFQDDGGVILPLNRKENAETIR